LRERFIVPKCVVLERILAPIVFVVKTVVKIDVIYVEEIKKQMAILKNKAQCAKCKDIIESYDRHDFKWCSCHSIFVDGGKEYMRRGGKFEDIIELSETDEGD
jgi:hypothetical protein